MKLKNLIALGATSAAAVSAAAVTAKKIGDKDYCPICAAKKLINKTILSQSAETNYDNGTALTPPMGWSSWNLFATKISEDLIKETADAIRKSGLADAGYIYVNIDDCWQASERGTDGRLECDRATFPNGIKSLVEYVNSLGLKLGIYSSNGTHTCEDYPASLRHEAIDADTFAQWGVEYFKYDFCHHKYISEKAPKITLCEFSKLGEKSFACFKPSQFTLTGRARIIKDDNKNSDSGEYIAGLLSRNGTASINVEVDEDGEYAVTLTVVKEADDEKFLRIMVNGTEEYHIYSDRSQFPRGYRRIQTTVKLTKGVNTVTFDNPVGSKRDSAAIQYKLMGRELKRATREYAEKNGTKEKPIVYSICEWGANNPYKWGREAGNLWRTTPDIKAFWASIIGIYEINVKLDKYSVKGGWNDPDMLEVGNGNLTYEENKAHFSLWCMMCAPLILGNDVRKFIKADGTVDTENKVYKILTNKTLIGINQDPLGVQCKRIKTGLVDVLVKPLEGSRAAICVLNKGTSSATTKLDIAKISNVGILNLPKKDSYKVVDAWEDTVLDGVSTVDAVCEKHGVKVYIVE